MYGGPIKSCVSYYFRNKNATAIPLLILHPWIWPVHLWQRIYIDFAGPIAGQSFVVDSHFKWPKLLEMRSTTATATIKELRRLFATYGLPEQLVFDNKLMRVNQIKNIKCASYHPLSNGCTE